MCLYLKLNQLIFLKPDSLILIEDQHDAVKFAKLGSETIGGKGGGGRKDFAQAGGQDKSKIDEAFEKIKSLI